MKAHGSKKAFWQKAPVFVSKDDNKPRLMPYLGYRTIVEIRQSNPFVLNENKQILKALNLLDHQREALDEFFENIKFLASLIGCISSKYPNQR